MRASVSRFAKDASGATSIEYGLIAAGIAVAILTVVSLIGTNLTGLSNNVPSKLTTTPASGG